MLDNCGCLTLGDNKRKKNKTKKQLLLHQGSISIYHQIKRKFLGLLPSLIWANPWSTEMYLLIK